MYTRSLSHSKDARYGEKIIIFFFILPSTPSTNPLLFCPLDTRWIAVGPFVEFRPKLGSERTQSNSRSSRAYTRAVYPRRENNELTNFPNESFGLSGFQFLAELSSGQKSSFSILVLPSSAARLHPIHTKDFCVYSITNV